MATTLSAPLESEVASGPRLDHQLFPAGRWLFLGIMVAGLAFAGFSIFTDTKQVGEGLAIGTFAFLALALLIALGFEFVNGFHDTANAVATVIYTHAMPAPLAVVWSGFFNFLGVMASSGAVAYSIITLLPVDLILHVGSSAGFAMIFALLLAAVLWNLATWFVGLPNSSSHALIGSILGVGFANQLMSSGTGGTSGVDWSQATKVLTGLWMAPLIGFGAAALLLVVMKFVLKNPKLYKEPEGNAPPPKGVRALLIFTCTAVSFAHGGNDGQKGMGLIVQCVLGPCRGRDHDDGRRGARRADRRAQGTQGIDPTRICGGVVTVARSWPADRRVRVAQQGLGGGDPQSAQRHVSGA
jgi:PiT family inorganic phosphate transporter